MKESWREAWIMWLLLGLQFRKQAFGFRFRKLSFLPAHHLSVRLISAWGQPKGTCLDGMPLPWDETLSNTGAKRKKNKVAGCWLLFLWYESVWSAARLRIGIILERSAQKCTRISIFNFFPWMTWNARSLLLCWGACWYYGLERGWLECAEVFSSALNCKTHEKTKA